MELYYSTKGYVDFANVMRNLSKSATWLWWGLVEKRNNLTNECIFKSKNGIEAKKVSKGYKELRKANLIIRVRRQHYLINPYVYLVDSSTYMEVKNRWNRLIKEGK